MADTVYLSDGSMEIIFDEKPVFWERLIREKLGDDAARCFTEMLDEMREELDSANEENDDYEKVADGCLQMCHDALDTFRLLKTELAFDRLNRKKVIALVNEGYDNLNKNL